MNNTSRKPPSQHEATYARIDEIGAVARSRMMQCDPITVAARGGAEVDYMTPDELREMHELKMSLPTFGELREAARLRIQSRIAARKAAQLVGTNI